MYKRRNNFSKSVELGQKKNNYYLNKCGICGKIFNNRYEKLVHNASHITIPLPRVRFQKCQLCPEFCTSAMNLKLHMYKGHGLRFDLACRVVLTRVEDETRIVDKTHFNGAFGTLEEDSLDRNEKLIECCDEVKVETVFDDDLDLDTDPVKIDNSFVDNELELKTPLFVYEDDLKKNWNNNNEEDAAPQNDYPNKIIFEDDVFVSLNPTSIDSITVNDDGDGDDDNVENTECIANHDKYRNGYQPMITFEDDVINIKPLEEVNSSSDSIAYDTLVQPGEFVCKRCGKIYQNRLVLIIHETSHLRWKRPSPSFCKHCDRYIANGPRSLHNHIRRSHPDVDSIKKTSRTCLKCGLKYHNYSRHRLNYHTEDRYANKNIDISNGDRNATSDGSVSTITKLMDVCELCYTFLMRRQKCKYVAMGEVEFVGRRPCQVCGKEHFVLKSVKRVIISPNRRGWKKRTKYLSNEDRLKIIFKRFKKIK